MNEEKDLNDISKGLVLLVEDSKNKIKHVVKDGIDKNLHKEVVKAEAMKVIDNFESESKQLRGNFKDFIAKTRKALVKMFSELYKSFLNALTYASLLNPLARDINTFINSKVSKGTLNQIKEQVKTTSFIFGPKQEGPVDIDTKFKWSSGRSGYTQMQIEDYSKLVNIEMQKIIKTKLLTDEIKDGKHHRLSIRNLAECAVRYEHHLQELETLRNQGTKLVLVSQHHDASNRCRPWQGRVYSLDGTRGVTPDSNKKKFVPLEEATKGHNLFGYNCRHRLIKYIPDMYVPNTIKNKVVKKHRRPDEIQRKFERQIREQKEIQAFSNSTERRNNAIQLSKELQEKYIKFSQENKIPYYPWRCSISKDERDIMSTLYASGDRKLPSTVHNLDVLNETGKSLTESEKHSIINYKLIDQEEFKEMSQKTIITQEQADIIYNPESGYTITDVGRDINDAIRNNQVMTPEQANVANTLDEVVSKNTASSDLTVFRYVNMDFLNYYYEDTNHSPTNGAVLIDRAFMSTSAVDDMNKFSDRGIKMIINIPQGTNMLVTSNKGESEVILPRNTKIKQIAQYEQTGRLVLHYEIIE